MPRRPVLRYHGGKWRLARWIIQHFPEHRIYVEPYGGGASVLMQKCRSHAEVYNDLDSEVVQVFRVLQDPESAWKLQQLVELTPFSRVEYERMYESSSDPIEQARRTIARSFMGFGSSAIFDADPGGMRTRASTWATPTGFRPDSNKSGTTPAHDWMNYPLEIRAFVERLRGVVIENRPALDVIRQHDRRETLFYVDPPYVLATRGKGRYRNSSRLHTYRYEMTDEDHRELAAVLRQVEGLVIISGYPSPLYDELYDGWLKVERGARADQSLPRVECLWISPKAAELISKPLFEVTHA